jgi:hypothetical protein
MADSAEIDLKMENSNATRQTLKAFAVRKEVERKIRKHTNGTWRADIHVWITTAFNQKWMDVAAEHTQSDVKNALYDENVQLALISSLVLTMVFPLMYEFNIDWYEDAQSGFISRMTEWLLGWSVYDDYFKGWWHDLTMAGYNWGVACLLTCVLGCVFQLIIINQITEEQSITYVKALGPMAKKFSFRVMIIGLILPLAGPMSIRINSVMQTPGGFFHYGVSGIIVVYILFTIFRGVKALYVCVEESEAYDDIVLSMEECQVRCDAYFKKFPDEYTLEGFSNLLMFVTPKLYKVPLTYATKVRACTTFYRTMAKREGLKLSEELLAQLAIEGAAKFVVDHRGQEMDLGDELNIPGDAAAQGSKTKL